MQFRLAHLLTLVTAFCGVLGLLFASPPIVGMPVILLLLTVWSPIWIIGAVFGRERRQAFFLGGLVCGLPFCYFSYLHAVYMLEGYQQLLRQGDIHDDLWLPAYRGWWWTNIVLVLPWLTAIIGGVAGALTYRFVAANREPKTRNRMDGVSQ